METSFLRQKAVLWPTNGSDREGEPTIDLNEKKEISVRWEEKKTEMADPQGNVIITDATVVVDRELTKGDILRLGKFEDLPATLDNLNRVISYSAIPDVKGRKFRRVVLLSRLSNELPATA